MLGKFLIGMPSTVKELHALPTYIVTHGCVKKPVIEEEEKRERWIDDRPYADGDYAYNDMNRAALARLQTVAGERVVVCPQCATDVQPVFCTDPEVLANADRWFAAKLVASTCSTATCLRCNTAHFIPELVARGSFRLVFPTEDTSGYHCYLRETFTRVNLDDKLGHWVWVHGFLVRPCAFGDVRGDTFADLDAAPPVADDG
jgi:hypothetical protein